MMYPKRKWSHRWTKADVEGKPNESSLQEFADNYIAILRLHNIRIPDGVFRWVNGNPSVPIWFRIWFNKTFAGMPDNTILIPIGKYSLALNLELKSAKGRLHGKQVSESRKNQWIVVRSSDEIKQAIDEFVKHASSYAASISQGVPDVERHL